MLKIKNIETPEPIIELYGPIGFFADDSGALIGESGDNLASALNYLATAGKKRIKVYINSYGGKVEDAQSMFAAIKSCPIPVDTVNVGVCASSAGIVLQAGKQRYATSWSKFMCHEASGGSLSDLQAINDAVAKMLCEASGIDEIKMAEMMRATTWLNADQCKILNLIDAIIDISVDEEAEKPVITNSVKPKEAYLSFQNFLSKKKTSQPI